MHMKVDVDNSVVDSWKWYLKLCHLDNFNKDWLIDYFSQTINFSLAYM